MSMNDNIVVEDGVAEDQILVSTLPDPVNSAQEHDCSKDSNCPVHVCDLSDHWHVLWEDIEQHHDDAPEQRDDIDGIAPSTKVKVRSWRKMLSSSQYHA